MIALMKPIFFTDGAQMVNVDLRAIIEKPIYRDQKEQAPLWCFCKLNDTVSIKDGKIYAGACNIKEYTAIQLDYDSGVTIHEFIDEFQDKFMFAMYTSYNYGFKEGDRFRVIIPLEKPMPQSVMGWAFSKTMSDIFPGCDTSCFARAHFQACPCIRSEGAPYFKFFNRVRRYFQVPYGSIEENRKHALDVMAYDCAVEEFNSRYGEQDNFDYTNIINWSQDKLDCMVEGNRNNTMFGVLCFCAKKGVPVSEVEKLDVQDDCVDEWNRMLKRVYM